MKFLRWLCNFLYFIVLCFGLSVTQVLVYDVVSVQDGIQDTGMTGIHVYGGDDKIGCIDGYVFMGEDLGVNLTSEPKYRVRNWVDKDGWRKATGWADLVIDKVVGVVKPIVVPVAQVNAIKNYYRINDGEENDVLFTEAQVKDLAEAYEVNDKAVMIKNMNDALYEAVEYFDYLNNKDDFYVTQFVYNVDHVEMSNILLSEYQYDTSTMPDYIKEDNFGVWENKNRKLYNQIWKLNKYNKPNYDKYFKKFIDNSRHDLKSRYIKSAVSVLYYQQIVAIVFAIFVIKKYPINLFSYRYSGKKEKIDEK